MPQMAAQQFVTEAKTVSELANVLATSEHAANNIVEVLRYRSARSDDVVNTVIRAEEWFADRNRLNGHPTYFWTVTSIEDYSEKSYFAEGVTKLDDNQVSNYKLDVTRDNAARAIEIADVTEELDADIVAGEMWFPKSGVDVVARYTGE